MTSILISQCSSTALLHPAVPCNAPQYAVSVYLHACAMRCPGSTHLHPDNTLHSPSGCPPDQPHAHMTLDTGSCMVAHMQQHAPLPLEGNCGAPHPAECQTLPDHRHITGQHHHGVLTLLGSSQHNSTPPCLQTMFPVCLICMTGGEDLRYSHT